MVRDIMRTPVVTIKAQSSLREAVELMETKKTNGLVVIDSKDRVTGIISSWDVISYIVPDYLEDDKHLASFEAGSVLEDRVKDLEKGKIEEFMTEKVHTVRESSTVMAAATILAEFRIRQLPVVDDEDKLVGYLNRTDVKHVIAKILGIGGKK